MRACVRVSLTDLPGNLCFVVVHFFYRLNRLVYMALAMLIIFPVTLLRKMTALKFTSAVSVVSMLALAGVIVYRNFEPFVSNVTGQCTSVLLYFVCADVLPLQSCAQVQCRSRQHDFLCK